ncbi:uncharacterized protein N7506_003993 [Penicillium brevicompactum]|uniref:uncharacterized protein n=1 Tax=Penicillium brevicompactum TaxID=5074 RepID=UPI0025409C40|nr:uncharacterized protein N7506_003993 [Penicillium brevicompactum]KAJ5335971.1 hypothetical protein N7506_003993 [Penicillium brevicompactum]
MHLAPAFGMKLSFVDDIHAKLAPLIYKSQERSPTTPTLSLADTRAVADMAHIGGSLAVVDNTFLSRHFQTSLDFEQTVCLFCDKIYQRPHHEIQSTSNSNAQGCLMRAITLNCLKTK